MFLALDSVSHSGGYRGNIDDQQFRWIHRQLIRAEHRREIVIAFAHHPLRTMTQPGVPGRPAHPGLPAAGTSWPVREANAPTRPGEPLESLLLRHPGLVALITGHEHRNDIRPHLWPDARGNAPSDGFWEIVTASHVDWPQQSRLIDLIDHRDGTLSIVTTMIDHVSPASVGDGPPHGGVGELAAISRQLSYSDPRHADEREGKDAARGTRRDRNTRQVIRRPYPA